MEKKRWMKDYGLILLAGVVVGIAALVLTAMGNPKNMGFCIACFERDIAGALGLHSAAVVQYIRPEIIGMVLGAMIAALAFKEFKARAGSSPAIRFVAGRGFHYTPVRPDRSVSCWSAAGFPEPDVPALVS